jgi:hypothetical protein
MLMKKARGLTLAEMTVIIMILALLVLLLLPIFANTRIVGKRSSCANNIRSIICTMHLYADDSTNGCFPKAATGTATMWMLYPKYINDLGIFSCPSNPTLHLMKTAVAGVDPGVKMGYWMDTRHTPDEGPAGIVSDAFDKNTLSSSHGTGEKFALILGQVDGSASVITSLTRKVNDKGKTEDISVDESAVKELGLEFDTWLKD